MTVSAAAVEKELRAEGLEPTTWSNGPGHVYERHTHRYHKVLVCVEGSITFHTGAGDVVLEEGDRLELPPGIEHAATAGASGVTCLEAQR
jgi:quercetin dioxygenase-like cupin family protein